MFLLDTITKSVKAQTLVAPISALECVVSYNNVAMNFANVDNGTHEVVSGVIDTPTVIVPSPSDDFQFRDARYISIYNQNNETHTVIVGIVDSVGPTIYRIHRVTLYSKWRAEYNKDKGWSLYDEFGRIVSKTTVSPIIAQSNPGAVLTDIYTAGAKTTIGKIIVCNRAAVAKTFRVSLAPLGAADAASQYLFYDTSIAKNDTKEIFGPFELVTTDKIRVYGQDNNVSFTVNGFTET